ncbi:MAG TPA: Crp/Fnr family transcriptional regulator [Syntrophales bacterium]|nr:Crp/Fnr family transcriptional regulator [Syntrophales bacterium]HPQ43404.1 Crp/Fnr family transcriptional regulator [Syntrophales bacterium]
MTDNMDALSKSQLFGGVSEGHLKEIARIAVERHFDKGAMIFFDGDEGAGFYLVVTGAVKVYKLSSEGREQILHIVSEGGTIGAVPVFSGESYPANAQAIVESRLLFFSRTKFTDLITNNPSLTMNILAILSMRLREFTIQIENLSLKEIPGRLAAYLLDRSEELGNTEFVRLNISKLQLAHILGTGPESLSRVLGDMKGRHLIEVDGSTIRLLDRGALEACAQNGKGIE